MSNDAPLMKCCRVLVAMFVVAVATVTFADKKSDGFESLIRQDSLAGWKAFPAKTMKDWSLNKGVVTGKGSGSSYLKWKDDKLTDFDLRLKYRLLTKGNTGIEIHARPDKTGKRIFESYHADIGHVGIGDNILGAWDFHFGTRREHPNPRGTRIVIHEDESITTSRIKDPFETKDIRQRDWNDVRVLAKGNRYQFFINGKLSAEFTDNAAKGQLSSGAIALQIHDRGMIVEFKDIRLKRLNRQ
ncbi:MAG: hypothetical protein CMJ78_08910 [Planctomycetaceae bacterium]|nr:hypothetical protein [Planctomycetaceae bacterium]